MSRLTFSNIGTSQSGITKVWSVFSDATFLGRVSWFAHWRKYAFCPAQSTTFDASCLEEIAIFMGAETMRHKA